MFVRPNTPDEHVYNAVFVKGELHFPFATCPRTIIDAGAYTGLSSVYFASRFPDATIIAIEPERANFQLLSNNTRGWSNIVALQAALWKDDTELDLQDPGVGEWGYQVVKQGDNEMPRQRVPGKRLRTVMTEQELKHIDLLKLDIEGSEIEVLGDSDGWMNEVSALVVELHDNARSGCRDALVAVARHFDCHITLTEDMEVYIKA